MTCKILNLWDETVIWVVKSIRGLRETAIISHTHRALIWVSGEGQEQRRPARSQAEPNRHSRALWGEPQPKGVMGFAGQCWAAGWAEESGQEARLWASLIWYELQKANSAQIYSHHLNQAERATCSFVRVVYRVRWGHCLLATSLSSMSLFIHDCHFFVYYSSILPLLLQLLSNALNENNKDIGADSYIISFWRKNRTSTCCTCGCG